MFDSLLKAVVGVVTLPIDVAADALTLGGSIVDRDRSFTEDKLSDVFKNIERATKP